MPKGVAICGRFNAKFHHGESAAIPLADFQDLACGHACRIPLALGHHVGQRARPTETFAAPSTDVVAAGPPLLPAEACAWNRFTHSDLSRAGAVGTPSRP